MHSFSLIIVLFISCTSKVSDNQHENSGAFDHLLHDIKQSFSSSSLTPAEYTAWVKEQKGVTYNTVSNQQFELSLIFHPPQLEAYNSAVANGSDPKKELKQYLEIQKEYFYCTAGCAVKYESASDPVKKTELLNLLRQQLTVVKNTDTLRTIITEAFPSQVMNQPNTLLILIPAGTGADSYKIQISGQSLDLEDCTLMLRSSDIQSFPIIKL